MDENTFWLLFWLIVCSCITSSYYFDYKATQYKKDSEVKIAKIREDSNKHLTDSYEKIHKKLLELK